MPAPRTSVLPDVEAQVFAQAGVDVAAFRSAIAAQGLALIVSHNVTQRDRADRQQPFNLAIPGGTSSIAKSGTIYDVSLFCKQPVGDLAHRLLLGRRDGAANVEQLVVIGRQCLLGGVILVEQQPISAVLDEAQAAGFLAIVAEPMLVIVHLNNSSVC